MLGKSIEIYCITLILTHSITKKSDNYNFLPHMTFYQNGNGNCLRYFSG